MQQVTFSRSLLKWTFLVVILGVGAMLWASSPEAVGKEANLQPMHAFFQEGEANPAARYLWQWIKFGCYTLGGAAGAMGLMFGIFGFWVGRGPIIKQGIISAVAGFAFVLVIPFVRIVFSEWVEFAEEDPFIPEVETTRMLSPQDGNHWAAILAETTRPRGG